MCYHDNRTCSWIFIFSSSINRIHRHLRQLYHYNMPNLLINLLEIAWSLYIHKKRGHDSVSGCSYCRKLLFCCVSLFPTRNKRTLNLLYAFIAAAVTEVTSAPKTEVWQCSYCISIQWLLRHKYTKDCHKKRLHKVWTFDSGDV